MHEIWKSGFSFNSTPFQIKEKDAEFEGIEGFEVNIAEIGLYWLGKNGSNVIPTFSSAGKRLLFRRFDHKKNIFFRLTLNLQGVAKNCTVYKLTFSCHALSCHTS